MKRNRSSTLFNFHSALASCFLAIVTSAALSPVASAAEPQPVDSPTRPIPVIFDTDIGDDIDDTWALGFLLRCPEVDVRLVVGDMGKPTYRAKLIAKFLEAAGRTDIPVGIGLDRGGEDTGPQAKWVDEYNLEDYPGKVHQDGVQAIIDVIMASERPITVLAVGPLPNIAEALKREPRIAQRAVFVGMHGSVRRGYGGSHTVSAEYNVRADASACRQTFEAAWPVTITPLDTCGLVVLSGDRYARVRNSQDPIASAIIENYRLWSSHRDDRDAWEKRSSTLFDTVAVYLVFADEWLRMEQMGIRVTDDGFTRVDPSAKEVRVATEWRDMDAFKDFLVRRITSQ